MEDPKVLQREALGWYDLAETCKSRLRVVCFMLNNKGIARDEDNFSLDDLDALDEQAVSILREVVDLLDSFQSGTHLHGQELAQELAGSSESVIASKA